MSPEQEQQACDALVNLGWMENDHALHGEGVRVISETLGCSVDEARSILRDLRARKLIDVLVPPAGDADAGSSRPFAQQRWIRPQPDPSVT